MFIFKRDNNDDDGLNRWYGVPKTTGFKNIALLAVVVLVITLLFTFIR